MANYVIPISEIFFLKGILYKNEDNIYDDINYTGAIEDLTGYSATIEEI